MTDNHSPGFQSSLLPSLLFPPPQLLVTLPPHSLLQSALTSSAFYSTVSTTIYTKTSPQIHILRVAPNTSTRPPVEYFHQDRTLLSPDKTHYGLFLLPCLNSVRLSDLCFFSTSQESVPLSLVPMSPLTLSFLFPDPRSPRGGGGGMKIASPLAFLPLPQQMTRKPVTYEGWGQVLRRHSCSLHLPHTDPLKHRFHHGTPLLRKPAVPQYASCSKILTPAITADLFAIIPIILHPIHLFSNGYSGPNGGYPFTLFLT